MKPMDESNALIKIQRVVGMIQNPQVRKYLDNIKFGRLSGP